MLAPCHFSTTSNSARRMASSDRSSARSCFTTWSRNVPSNRNPALTITRPEAGLRVKCDAWIRFNPQGIEPECDQRPRRFGGISAIPVGPADPVTQFSAPMRQCEAEGDGADDSVGVRGDGKS